MDDDCGLDQEIEELVEKISDVLKKKKIFVIMESMIQVLSEIVVDNAENEEEQRNWINHILGGLIIKAEEYTDEIKERGVDRL